MVRSAPKAEVSEQTQARSWYFAFPMTTLGAASLGTMLAPPAARFASQKSLVFN